MFRPRKAALAVLQLIEREGGIIVATISIISNALWFFTFPVQSLILIFLASLVIYGLVVYGEPDTV